MLFFTGDLHLFEPDRALKDFNCRSNTEYINKLIRNWNKKIRNNDDTFILGDFCTDLNTPFFAAADRVLEQLNGTKYLVPSLDDLSNGAKPDFNHMQLLDPIIILDTVPRVVLSHYPLFRWEDSAKDVLHFHAHLHGYGRYSGDYKRIRNIFDVGLPGSATMVPYSFYEAVKNAKE